MDLTDVLKIDTYRLVDGDPDNPQPVKTKKDAKTTSGVTIQVPTVASFRASIPEVVIPDGMSLLVAFPGVTYEQNIGDKREMFLLITPKKCEP